MSFRDRRHIPYYLLDTNHCIYFLNGLEKALEKCSMREQQVLTRVLACADAMIYFSEATLVGYHKRETPY